MTAAPGIASDHEARSSPHAAQLEQGFARLVFVPELEAEFREAFNERMRQRLLYALMAGALFFMLFGIKDIFALPAEVWVWTAGIRLGVIVPSILLIYYFSRTAGAVHTQRWMAAGGVIALYGLMTAIGISTVLRHPLPYEGLLLVTFFVYFLAGLRLRTALLVAPPSVGVFLLGSIWLHQPAQQTVVHIFYLLTANGIGIIGLYLIEHLAREVWLTEQLARFRAERDPLTLSFNRRALMLHLQRLWGQARRQRETLMALMIDADHFKQYNDAYGHLAGDECLRRISAALEKHMRRPLDMLGRYGGEEFLALLYAPKPADIPRLAEQLREAVELLTIPHRGSPLQTVSISIGAAWQVPGMASTEADLLERADQALYAAKSSGRNRVVIDAPPVSG